MLTTKRTVQLLTAVGVLLPVPSYFVVKYLTRQLAMSQDNWLGQSPRWISSSENNLKALLLSNTQQAVPDVKLAEIVAKSAAFPIPFPVETVRCDYLRKKTRPENLERNANSTYPLLHEHALLLCAAFLNYQKRSGNVAFYKDMSLLDFIDRLLSKRAVAFVGRSDHYMLLDGTQAGGGWEGIGGPDERPPLTLENCLSYDEIKLSALLSVSSHSFFINDGARNNYGRFEESRRGIEDNGVIIGLIGARLEKRNVMEYREIMKTKEQNVEKLGYGKPSLQGVFLEFYGDVNATYQVLSSEAFQSEPTRYKDLGRDEYFDSLMFERRIALSIDTLLIEANDRAKKENKKAYVHVVGLGLGVWKIYSGQDIVFMDTFAKRIEALRDVLTEISDIRFAYIRHNMVGPYKDGDTVNKITIHIENKNPQVKLTDGDEGKLLVVSYAWDGNAFPGNEFWLGPENLAASGDPAAAASSQISELHNFYINPKVSASNLRVATLNGLVTFREYQELHKDD